MVVSPTVGFFTGIIFLTLSQASRNGWVHYSDCATRMLMAFSVMVAETISLGILSLPSVLATLGFIP